MGGDDLESGELASLKGKAQEQYITEMCERSRESIAGGASRAACVLGGQRNASEDREG